MKTIFAVISHSIKYSKSILYNLAGMKPSKQEERYLEEPEDISSWALVLKLTSSRFGALQKLFRQPS